jgi:hypothetical protein
MLVHCNHYGPWLLPLSIALSALAMQHIQHIDHHTAYCGGVGPHCSACVMYCVCVVVVNSGRKWPTLSANKLKLIEGGGGRVAAGRQGGRHRDKGRGEVEATPNVFSFLS